MQGDKMACTGLLHIWSTFASYTRKDIQNTKRGTSAKTNLCKHLKHLSHTLLSQKHDPLSLQTSHSTKSPSIVKIGKHLQFDFHN